MTKSTKIENIKTKGRNKGKNKGREERKKINVRILVFHSQFCDPRKPLRVIPITCGLSAILCTILQFK